MQILVILILLTQAIDMYQLFSIGGYGVIPNIVFCFILYLLLAIKILLKKEKYYLKNISSAFKFLILICIAVLLSCFYPIYWGNSVVLQQFIKSSFHFYFIILFTIICYIYPIDNKTWSKFIKIWLILSIFVNLFGIYQIIARAFGLPFAWLEYNNVSLMARNTLQVDSFQQLSLQFQNFFRATSFFSEPSALAVFNSYTLTFIIIPYVQNKKNFLNNKTLTSLVFILALIGLFLTFSLTGLMCITSILILMLIIENKKFLKKFILISFISFVVVIITDILVKDYSNISILELFSERIEGIVKGGTKVNKQITGESFTTRIESAQEGIKLWEKSPITGIGLGTHQYHPESKYTFGGYTILVALTETGIIGFIGFIGMFFFLFYDSYKLKLNISIDKNSDDDNRLQGIIIYIVLLLFVVNFFSANHFISPPLWNFIGMIFAIFNNNVNNHNLLIQPYNKTIN